MEEFTEAPRRPNPRRRKRSKLQIFKEAYLPMIIIAVTLVLILVFVIGGISRMNARKESMNQTEPPVTTDPTPSTVDPYIQWQEEADALMAQAAPLTQDYDYEGALAILEQFSGDMALFPALQAMHDQYTAELNSMVPWTGNQVINLSIHLLIADPQRAFHDDTYARSYRNNFITTTEFSAILQQLYDNECILVSLSDLYELRYDESSGRDIYVAKTLLLPPGKTPVMLTETNANYYTYMTDSNGDGKPDAGADGFAYKLCYGEDGFYNEYVLSDGTVTTGAYDMVPILEAFIAEHPDFSYRDARAIIAITGYDGILGYRVNSSKLGAAQKQEEQAAAAEVVNALREAGYDIACFTYNNVNFDKTSATEIQSDLQDWAEVVASVIGPVDILAFPKEVDIAGADNYTGNTKFNVMYNEGYRFFLGTGIVSWDQVDNLYVRHNRLMVTGSYLTQYPERFAGLFDATAVLDPYRANFR